MSNVVIKFEGWNSITTPWGGSPWSQFAPIQFATGQVGNVFIPTVVNGVSCTGYVGYVTVWGQVVTNQDPNWQNIAT